ncbi:MAG: hypothetical protein RLZZ621_1120 [Gemmatimonadota bacterium]|jgi:hypothetical protein
MRASRLFPVIESQEPVGLVIADGGLGDHVPRFSAFVWGPVPDDAVELPRRATASRPTTAHVDATAVAPAVALY